jgi:hypothetical protein
LEDPGIDGRIILKRINFTLLVPYIFNHIYLMHKIYMIKKDLQEMGWGAWNGLIWLRIGTGGGLL